MKKILWVSRHTMTDDQKCDLERIYGEVTIEQLDETVRDVSVITAHEADVYAVVLPLQLLADLKKMTDKEIIQPVSGRVKTDQKVLNKASGTYETEYVFQHLCWQRVVKLVLETENLTDPEGE